MVDPYASTLQTIHQSLSNGQTSSSFKNRTVHAPVNPCPKQTSPIPTDPVRPPLLVPACPSPSRRYPLRPQQPLWPLWYLLPPLTPDSWPVAGRRRTRNSPQSILSLQTTPTSYARTYECVCVCAREDRIHPVRHWLVRAGPIQHPGNYPGPAAVEHPLATHPPPLYPTHATMPARW